MTSLIPQATHAEDQPYARSILTFHVVRAGLGAGALLSVPSALLLRFFSRSRAGQPPLGSTLLLASFRGSVAGAVLGFVALRGRMLGRDEVEWQDRAWRLLSNRGQTEVDNFVLAGAALGAAAVAARRPVALLPGRPVAAVLGGAGLGTVGGTAAYLGWRYGVKGGRWEEAVVGVEEGVRAAEEGLEEGVRKARGGK